MGAREQLSYTWEPVNKQLSYTRVRVFCKPRSHRTWGTAALG